MNQPLIRLATAADLPAMNEIYNYYVPRSTCTYQEKPDSLAARRQWLERHSQRHPITVATIDDAIVGWASLSPFHSRSAYRYSVEDSIYVDHRHQRKGIGRALLEDLIHRARDAHHHAIIALIDAEQAASIALHRSLGFEQAGLLRQVGFKFERWLDVVYLQLLISP